METVQTPPATEQGICYGVVEEFADLGGRVSVDNRQLSVKRATSCLLDPIAGDRVLLCLTPGCDEAFVLAILERDTSAATVSFPGDVAFRAPHGQLCLAASESVDVMSPKEVNLLGGDVAVKGESASVVARKIDITGDLVHATLCHVRTVAETIDNVIGRLHQKIKYNYRQVEEVEDVKAGRLTMFVENLLSMHGKYTFMTAEKDVKIDGEHIHMG